MDLEYIDYLQYFNQIEEALIRANQIDLLHKTKVLSINDNDTGYEEKQPMEIESVDNKSPSDEPEVQLIMEILASLTHYLDNAERRLLLLYWGNGYSVGKIYKTFQLSPYDDYLMDLNLKSSKDIYVTIEKIIKKYLRWFEKNYPDYHKEFDLNAIKMKNLFKTYFQYFA